MIKVIQRAVMSHEGFVRQTLVDDKGTVCIIVFGAPVSHEGDLYIDVILMSYWPWLCVVSV